jgi:DNA-binding IclR family transcriptional regulator
VAASLRSGVVLPILRSAAGQVFGAFLPRELTRDMIDAELLEADPPDEDDASWAEAEVALDVDHPITLPDGMIEVDLKGAARESKAQLRITRAEAEARLEDVRRSKLARNIDLEPESDRDDKVIAISAPVFDAEGMVVLAITALGYSAEIDPDFDAPFRPSVLPRARCRSASATAPRATPDGRVVLGLPVKTPHTVNARQMLQTCRPSSRPCCHGFGCRQHGGMHDIAVPASQRSKIAAFPRTANP